MVQLLNIAMPYTTKIVQLENNCTATNGKIYTGYAIRFRNKNNNHGDVSAKENQRHNYDVIAEITWIYRLWYFAVAVTTPLAHEEDPSRFKYKYVTGSGKSLHLRTKSEFNFIAQDSSYTKDLSIHSVSILSNVNWSAFLEGTLPTL